MYNREQGYAADSIPGEVVQALREGRRKSKYLIIAQCSKNNGKLRYQDRVYVPNHMPLKLHLIQEHHETPAAGHPGRAKTLELLARNYYWPDIRKKVDRFCRNCHPCKRSQTSRHAPFGILRPLSIPEDA